MKTILITGATGNLGNSVTKTFLDKGYQIIATTTSKNGLKELPSQVQGEVVDLTNEQEAEQLIGRIIQQHKKIDAALMLVGGFAMGKIKDTGFEQIQKQIDLNFKTAYHVTRPVLEQMEKQKSGRLVFIGSRPALVTKDGKNMIAYALSKSMLFKLAEYINEEVKGKNIAAAVVAPSTLDTPENRKSMPDADPSRWVSTAELAGIIEFICSDAARAMKEPVVKVYGEA
jgi:NAD(P)-dependent dehydrogenase (short-subunit alcohol dehydrogenase family)